MIFAQATYKLGLSCLPDQSGEADVRSIPLSSGRFVTLVLPANMLPGEAKEAHDELTKLVANLPPREG